MAVLLTVSALGCVMVAVSLMVQFDGASSGDRRLAAAATSVSRAAGSRARRRAERKASPVLYILLSVLAMVVVAALV